MIRKTSMLIGAAAGFSLLAAAAVHTGQQQNEPKTFEGRIVDLHYYLSLEGTPELGDPAIAGKNFGGPIGLLVERDRVILGKTTDLYILVAEPERDTPHLDDKPRDRSGPNMDDHKPKMKHYQQAQRMTGENVQITGRQFERDDVRAIEIRRIEKKEASPANRDRPRDGGSGRQPTP